VVDRRTEPLATLLAVSRLLASPADEIEVTIVREARNAFAAEAVALVGRAEAPPAAADVLDRQVRLARTPDGLLLLLEGHDLVLALTRPAAVDSDVAIAFADAASAALDRRRAVAEHERVLAQQQALTRAAKTLNGTLELDTVLARICHEASTLLECTTTVVYRGSLDQGLTIAAALGVPPEDIGLQLPAGGGLAGKVLLQERAMLTNDYQRVAELPPGAFGGVQYRSAMAAPMAWDGELRGVLSVAWEEDRGLTPEDLVVLETFAELAATACANASAHAGLALAARTDGLTGCLNHAALHEGLAREIERAVRTDVDALSLVLIDLDDFKQVNEANGHLAGDEVLRRAGHALRNATRPYDLAARYGGDEFALLAVEAEEDAAIEMGQRALERIAGAIRDLLPDGATVGTAGVAEWTHGVSATELIARADRALLYAKQAGHRGQVWAFSGVPDLFRPGRFTRTDRHMPEPPPMPRRPWPDERKLDERLRKRTRQLALANALGARVAAMTDPADVLEAAADELHRAFGYFCAAVIRIREDATVEAATLRGAPFLRLMEQRWRQPLDTGLIGRCLRTRRPVLSNDVRSEPEYQPTEETTEVRSELVVPLFVGDDLWGAIDVEELDPGAFDPDDVALLQTVAAQVGSALRSATLYAQLERNYTGLLASHAEDPQMHDPGPESQHRPV
jgi:diguanylate cyclase (GGDEF)-like protein